MAKMSDKALLVRDAKRNIKRGTHEVREIEADRKLPAGYQRWDPVRHLTSKRAMALYLEAAMAEAPVDAAYITTVLNDIARARGIMKLANDTGMTRAGLYKALAPGSRPSFDTVVKISKALGLKVIISKAA